MACSSSCPTKDHASWGDCVRSKGLKIAYAGIGGMDATRQKQWDKELQAYRAARAQGIEPAGTKMAQVQQAVEASDKAGKAARMVS